MSDEMSESQLEALVRDAVMGAVSGEPSVAPRQGDATVLLGDGAGVTEAVKRAVVATVSELLASKMLLAGSLNGATERLRQAAVDAEALWKAMKETEDALLGGAASEAQDEEPEAPTKPEADLPAKRWIPKTVEPSPATPEPVAGPAPAPAAATVEDGVIMVDGLEVVFGDKTPSEFKAFLREFVAHVVRGPVTPQWAGRLAQKHGWRKTPGTIAYQTDAYLGTLSRGKDKKGKSWWWLPGHPGPDEAGERTE